jgi:hypothetical protein
VVAVFATDHRTQNARRWIKACKAVQHVAGRGLGEDVHHLPGHVAVPLVHPVGAGWLSVDGRTAPPLDGRDEIAQASGLVPEGKVCRVDPLRSSRATNRVRAPGTAASRGAPYSLMLIGNGPMPSSCSRAL